MKYPLVLLRFNFYSWGLLILTSIRQPYTFVWFKLCFHPFHNLKGVLDTILGWNPILKYTQQSLILTL
jgi:hypothetical protein